MKKYPRMKRWLRRFGIASALVALLALVAVSMQFLIATMKLRSITARFVQNSMPLSWPEFYEHFPGVETALAAQPDFFAALEMLAAVPCLSEEEIAALPIEGYATLPELGDELSPAMLSALERRLSVVAPALAAVREAVAQDPFWFVPPTNPGGLPNLSRMSTVKEAARLFSMSAILHSERGDARAAIDAVTDGIRLAQVLHRGSLLIDELTRFACEEVALRSSLEYVLANTDPPADAVRELATLLSAYTDMRTGILGEMVYSRQFYETASGLSGLTELIKQSASNPWQHAMVYLPVVPGWIRMNQAYHLEMLYAVFEAWMLPWPDFKQRCDDASAAIPRFYFLSYIPNDMWPVVKSRELWEVGIWRCGRIALALELYSQEHKALPGDLAALVPDYIDDIPVEPYHSGPIAYAKKGDRGTLSFSCPDSARDVIFNVLADKNSTGPEK